MIKIKKVAAILLLSAGFLANAAEINITASFSPSMNNPDNNTFTNTTPQSGYCENWPNYCYPPSVSILFPINISATKDLNPNDEPRNSVYFKMPSSNRNFTVYNKSTGSEATVRFRVSEISGRLRFDSSLSNDSLKNGWVGGGFVYASSPCHSRGMAFSSTYWYHFLWELPNYDAACYKITTIPRQGNPHTINNMSIGYVLDTPNPLLLNSGVYEGTLNFTVGPGGDFDFGDNFQASDNNLTINFTLTVNHELQLTTTPEDRQVSLQPCVPGRVCTEEEGKANWERWMTTRIPPQLTGRSNFTLSSSGAFTVFVQCDQQIGQDCALQSENSAQQVPVRALLTLPDNIVDQSTGSRVIQKKLLVGKDITQNIFNTQSFGENRKGSIDFVVAQKDVDSMLKTRPDTYKGTVTVIFDPLIY